MSRPGLAALGLALLLAGCSADGGSPAGLPGSVPDGVTFPEPPATAPAAPPFELELLNGEVVESEAQWTERPMVLVFFESWCELCRDQQAGINELVEEYRDVVLFLGIAGLSSTDDVQGYVSAAGVDYPVGTDPSGELWRQYAVTEPPLVALVSKDGKLLHGWPGGTTGEALREVIEKLAVIGSR